MLVRPGRLGSQIRKRASRWIAADRGNFAFGTSLITSGQAAQYTIHELPASGKGLRLALAAYTESTTFGEVPVGNSVTYMAAAQILPGGSFATFTMGGNSSMVVPDGQQLWTDDLPDTFAFEAGTNTIGLWVWASGANIPSRGTGGSNGTELNADEGCVVGASVSTTPTASITDSLTRRRRLCGVVAMRMKPNNPAQQWIILEGDSQTAFVNTSAETNSATTDRARGDIARSLGQYYPVQNMGIGGAQASSMHFMNIPNYRALIVSDPYCVRINQFGINDFNNKGLTLAAVEAYLARWKRRYNNSRYVGTTISVQTTSSDSWVTETNQTPVSYAASIATYNTSRRAEVAYLERTIPIQGTDTQKWKVDNATARLNTVDGLHYSLNGVSLVYATRAAMKTVIDAAGFQTFSVPAVTLSGGTYDATGLIASTASLVGIMPLCVPMAGQFDFLATATTSFSVTVVCSGVLTITGTVLRLARGDGTGVNGTTNILDGQWRTVRVEANGTGIQVYLNDVLEITTTYTITSVQTNKQLTMTASNGNSKIRNVSIWNKVLGANATFGSLTASTDGLVAAWSLISNGNGLAGPSA